MVRNCLAVGLLLSATATVMAVDKVHFQPKAADKYQDVQTKKGEIDGKIEKESPSGIEIKSSRGKTATIPPGDVLVVEYDVGKGLVTDFRAPMFRLENAKADKDAARRVRSYNAELVNLRKLHKDVTGFTAAKAYVEFKIAEVAVLLAQEDSKDVKKRDEAIKLLEAFAKDNATRWTIMPALTMLARLQEEAGHSDGALQTYKKIAEVVPDEKLKLESKLFIGRLLLRTGKPKDAEEQLGGMLDKLSDDNPNKVLVRAYLAEAKISQNKLTGVEKDLAAMINATSDARLRGVAYNLLGDLFVKAGKTEDAFWAYLRVDALYNEEPEEHAKALYNLAELYTKIKKSDPGRAEDCARRLRDKRFAGSPFQKRLIAEKGDDTVKEEPKQEKKDKDAKKDK